MFCRRVLSYFCAREFFACGTHNRSNLHTVGGTSLSLLFDCILHAFSTSTSYDPQSINLSQSLTRSSSIQKTNFRSSPVYLPPTISTYSAIVLLSLIVLLCRLYDSRSVFVCAFFCLSAPEPLSRKLLTLFWSDCHEL